MSLRITIRFRESAEFIREGMEQQEQVSPPVPAWLSNIICGGAIIAGLGVALVDEFKKGTSFLILAFTFVAVLAILLFWSFVFKRLGPRARKWQAKMSEKSYKDWYRKNLGRDATDVVCTFDDTAFTLQTEEGVVTRHPWSSINRVVETASGLLIYTAPRVFYWFPKGIFASAEFDTLVAFLKSQPITVTQSSAKL